MFFQICFGLILCFHFHFVPVDAVLKSSEYVRWKRAINDEAQQGKCLAFQDIKGRNGQAVEYVCCNNCFDADESCRGTTYVGGSTLYYCTRCGSNTLNSSKLFDSFSCGGCNGQTRSKNTCKVQYIAQFQMAVGYFGHALRVNARRRSQGIQRALALMDIVKMMKMSITAQQIAVQ